MLSYFLFNLSCVCLFIDFLPVSFFGGFLLVLFWFILWPNCYEINSKPNMTDLEISDSLQGNIIPSSFALQGMNGLIHSSQIHAGSNIPLDGNGNWFEIF